MKTTESRNNNLQEVKKKDEKMKENEKENE